MHFESILFRDRVSVEEIERRQEPDFFGDLNLEQIINGVLRGRDEYRLNPYFYIPLRDEQSIQYRMDAMRELERPEVMRAIAAFAQSMRAMREELATSERMHYRWQKHRYFLDAVQRYCAAVETLSGELRQQSFASEGFEGLRQYLEAYAAGPDFNRLLTEERDLRERLGAIRYSVLIRGNAVTVRKYADESDYSQEVAETFDKFRQGAVKRINTEARNYADMNHVEATVLGYVAELHPDVFDALNRFVADHSDFCDITIARFDREVQFLVAYLEYVAKLRQTGLQFCYPEVTSKSKSVVSRQGFDLALAEKLRTEERQIVCNDFYLSGDERIVVVTGPNQGGKTTFARTVGQLHYLAAMGWLVPGEEAKLFLFDQIFTHFERQEDMKNMRGKLHDDLFRIHRILDRATDRSIVIMNEIFSSTSLRDALFLSQKVMNRIIQLDALCVYVTFIEELSTLGPQTVSMLSEIKDVSTAERTFRVVRRRADGRSYAMTLARQYGLVYEQLKGRIRT